MNSIFFQTWTALFAYSNKKKIIMIFTAYKAPHAVYLMWGTVVNTKILSPSPSL
jgi:hypothetical protein